MQIMSRPLVKTSGFRLIVNLDLVTLYLLCSVDVLYARYVHLSWRLIKKLAVESESNDVLSSCYYFLSQGGTFY